MSFYNIPISIVYFHFINILNYIISYTENNTAKNCSFDIRSFSNNLIACQILVLKMIRILFKALTNNLLLNISKRRKYLLNLKSI